MFTIDQIQAAHSKVKSGADFPAYISEIRQLGVISYETFVRDGHAEYYGSAAFGIASEAKYAVLYISETPDRAAFQIDLKSHQQGNTDYLAFCRDCARNGIYKWTVDLDKLTCTYYDRNSNALLVENIPQ